MTEHTWYADCIRNIFYLCIHLELKSEYLSKAPVQFMPTAFSYAIYRQPWDEISWSVLRFILLAHSVQWVLFHPSESGTRPYWPCLLIHHWWLVCDGYSMMYNAVGQPRAAWLLCCFELCGCELLRYLVVNQVPTVCLVQSSGPWSEPFHVHISAALHAYLSYTHIQPGIIKIQCFVDFNNVVCRLTKNWISATLGCKWHISMPSGQHAKHSLNSWMVRWQQSSMSTYILVWPADTTYTSKQVSLWENGVDLNHTVYASHIFVLSTPA